jgi:hypothetical protein
VDGDGERARGHGGIGIGPAPSQDGGAVDDEIAGTDEAAANRHSYHGDEQHLGHWSSGTRRPFPLLRGTGHPGGSLSVERQATGERERGPTDQPIVHVLIGEAPERAQEREQQQRFLTITAWAPARTSR